MTRKFLIIPIPNLVSQVYSRFDRIDVLVNNAATNPVFLPLVAIEERAWNKIMDVNIKGPFFLTVSEDQ